MSITDELRKAADDIASTAVPCGASPDYIGVRRKIDAIADRIDAEHESIRAESIIDMTDESMAEHGWVRGPLDADGKMWRSGDMSDSNWGVIEGIAYEDGRWFVSGHDTSAPWVPADSIRHHRAPTVEDVLEELLREYDRDDSELTNGEIIEMFAKRLTLAEEENA